ncbi:hypothetical protein Csa_001765 [Cucumis sativus]|nr:hypothetical protein Csa_001765 [Cucumis sativus]
MFESNIERRSLEEVNLNSKLRLIMNEKSSEFEIVIGNREVQQWMMSLINVGRRGKNFLNDIWIFFNQSFQTFNASNDLLSKKISYHTFYLCFNMKETLLTNDNIT